MAVPTIEPTIAPARAPLLTPELVWLVCGAEVPVLLGPVVLLVLVLLLALENVLGCALEVLEEATGVEESVEPGSDVGGGPVGVAESG